MLLVTRLLVSTSAGSERTVESRASVSSSAVTPPSRIVWTNEESGAVTVTTVSFEDRGAQTLLTFSELYPTKEACDEAITGSAAGLPEQFDQLDDLLAELAADA